MNIMVYCAIFVLFAGKQVWHSIHQHYLQNLGTDNLIVLSYQLPVTSLDHLGFKSPTNWCRVLVAGLNPPPYA